jgi:thiol-disulfide isomerase/thioredoxin
MEAFELLGSEFATNDGTVSLDTISKSKVILLYFAGDWIPPCRVFTQKLIDFYFKKNVGSTVKKEVEVIYASADRDAVSFKTYFESMPWAAIPYCERARFETLGSELEVEVLP